MFFYLVVKKHLERLVNRILWKMIVLFILLCTIYLQAGDGYLSHLNKQKTSIENCGLAPLNYIFRARLIRDNHGTIA